MNNIYGLSSPFFMLAPMDDVTDSAFRSLIKDIASPNLFMTEFTNVDGLQSEGKDKVKQKIINFENSSNLIAQIWGLKPNNFYRTAKEIVNKEYGQFIGVDLNMGCPDRSITKNGACSALIENRDLAKEIINATKNGLNKKLPLSVKTRLGYNKIDYSWHEFLLNQNLDMLIIHGRTKVQNSNDLANYQAINEIRKLRDKIAPNTIIVGNGDIKSKKEALIHVQKYKLDGIMIGRGIFSDPFIFSDNSPWNKLSIEKKISIFKRHIEYYKNRWHETKPVYVLNKFCKIYINNFANSREIREKLMRSKNIEELLLNLDNIKA